MKRMEEQSEIPIINETDNDSKLMDDLEFNNSVSQYQGSSKSKSVKNKANINVKKNF